MSWASRKRTTFILLILLAVLVVAGWISFSILYDTPTCFDGEQNGGEDGIDCGGVCERVCSFQAIDPVVLWSRFFEVAPGVYSAVALVENPNADTVAEDAPYSFKLRNRENILVYERKGTVDIPAQQQVPIFEPNLVTGDRTPARIFFEFAQSLNWNRDDAERADLRVRGINLEDDLESPRLTATLTNVSLVSASDVEVVAILLGLDGNAVAASRTVVDFLAPNDEVSLIFTWPEPFEEEIAETLIIPKVF